MGNSTFFDELGFSFASLSDGEKSFLDMLSSEDMYNHATSVYDLLQLPSMEVQQQQPLASAVAETSEVLNDAETPNSSSICTSSTDALKDDDQQSKRTQVGSTKKMPQSKKKKITKKQREPRFAFMTKTDIDHLDDGFRWRKYGQKAVKNSPFPRSYYRCTSTSCGVLKRVERSSTDPSIVVTTYEGNHKHLCPVTHHGALAILPERPCHFRGDASSIQQSQYQQLLQLQQQGYAINPSSFPNLRATSYSPSSDVPNHVAEEPHSSFSPSSLFRDQGLLQDMVSSQMRSEEKKNDELDYE